MIDAQMLGMRGHRQTKRPRPDNEQSDSSLRAGRTPTHFHRLPSKARIVGNKEKPHDAAARVRESIESEAFSRVAQRGLWPQPKPKSLG
jgi:hypothetical protein